MKKKMVGDFEKHGYKVSKWLDISPLIKLFFFFKDDIRVYPNSPLS